MISERSAGTITTIRGDVTVHSDTGCPVRAADFGPGSVDISVSAACTPTRPPPCVDSSHWRSTTTQCFQKCLLSNQRRAASGRCFCGGVAPDVACIDGLGCVDGECQPSSGNGRRPLKTEEDAASVSSSENGGEVAGFHVDIETCSGNYGKTHTVAQQRAACASFFGKLENISRAAALISQTLPRPLILAVDTGTGWACGQEPASGCINITWNGVSKPVSQHVVDLSDSAVPSL